MKSLKRKELKTKRDAVKNKVQLSSAIAENFLLTDLYKNAETVLLYYSVGSEVATDVIFSQAIADQKRVAFPLCLDKEGIMCFYYVNDISDLKEGMYGIKAPKSDCERFINCKNALCIVPGLAFDKNGYRIGYGRGYYDRFLSGFDGISVGLCFDEMLETALPTDKYDKKVDYLITDKKIYKFYL